MKRLIYLFFFSCLTGPALRAQLSYFNVHALDESLKEAKISLMYQSSEGLLWFGSSKGLFIYDGARYQFFPAVDSLPHNWVTAIYEDRDQRLWVGYKDGAIFYSEHQQALKPWLLEEGWPVVPVSGFQEDDQGVFWIATYGEGLYYHLNGHLYNINTDDGLLGNDIYTMVQSQAGRIWVGTDGGISICSIPDGRQTLLHITRKDGLPDEIVRALIPDKKGNLWIGTYDKGICYFDTESWSFDHPFPGWDRGIVNTLELIEDRELWIGTEDQGVFRYNFAREQLSPVRYVHQISGGKIFDLHSDPEGNIWLLNSAHGICSSNRLFEFAPGSLNMIQAILADHQDKVWVGTQDGLYTLEKDGDGRETYRPHLTDLHLNVISLYEDKYHYIWIGTFGSGVYCLDPRTGRMRHLTEKEGLTNTSILSIDGKEDQVWLATLGGVTEIDISSDIMGAEPIRYHHFNQNSGPGTNYIYTVFIDSKGQTWFGTDGKGISVLKNGKISNYTEVDSIPLKAVYSITEDDRGHIWFSTAREGIFEYDGTQFHRMSLDEGLRDLSISSLISDQNGHILMVNSEGIDLLEPETRNIIYYGEEVGITDINPNLNAVAVDQHGSIWIGLQNRLIRYTAPKRPLKMYPETLLSRVSVFLEPVEFYRRSVYQHNENNLIFDYMGLWYTAPSAVKYRYMLEGYDFDWIVSRDRRATYSNLSPGDYTFKLSATHNGTYVGTPQVQYHFRIKKPLWLQPWFVALTAILAVLFIYWIVRQREYRLKREALLKKEKVESQFEALKSQINPHFLFNNFNTLITIIEEDAELAVEYVEKLSDFYRSILQYREKEVIELEEEINLVNNYAFLLNKRYGDNLELFIHTNGAQSFVAPLTLQMLVENAIKHNVISKAKPLKIDILVEESGYISVINNRQEKLSPEYSTGFGLQSIRTRYSLLSVKKIRIEETPDWFKVSIPIIKMDKNESPDSGRRGGGSPAPGKTDQRN